jgi:serine/threonine-protein kinase
VKTCEACHRLFADDGGFCPIDGKPLVRCADTEPPSDKTDKRVGATFCGGRYQIWRRVADGGMGRVYQALDKQVERSVALKILHSDVAQDAVAVERFKREFECSLSLPHDHIVDVLAFEETEDGSYALVMEYLEGEELRMLLKREKVIPPERLVRMLSQSAVALQAAHDRKIVHRDLKPDNLFLCGAREGDSTKILDFGSVRDNSTGAKKLTVMGTTIGSPFYMSPEQAQALPDLDHRADVWSMAAIAYECLTGTLPFSGNNGPSILLAILSNDPKPPSEAGKAHGVPPTLDPVIEASLAKNHQIRTPTVGALLLAAVIVFAIVR